MPGWRRFTSPVSTRPLITGLGGLFLTIAVSRTILQLPAERPLGIVLAMELIIGLPGVGLLYGAYQLPSTNLRQDVYPYIMARCLAAIGVMLGVVLLLALSGLNRPFYTPFAATALGAVAGFAIGYNEARALSRARDAEQAQQDLQRTVQHLEASNERLEELPTPPPMTSRSRCGWSRVIYSYWRTNMGRS